MTYNELYIRMRTLDDMRQLRLPAKATAEVLMARAAIIPHIGELAQKQQSIAEYSSAEDAEKEAAFAELTAQECSAPDRRLSPAAFEQIAEAALANGPMHTIFGDDTEPTAWLSHVAAAMVELS